MVLYNVFPSDLDTHPIEQFEAEVEAEFGFGAHDPIAPYRMSLTMNLSYPIHSILMHQRPILVRTMKYYSRTGLGMI